MIGAPKPMRVEIMDRFQFTDGIRWAWVTWILGDGERRAIAVRGIDTQGPVIDEMHTSRRWL